MDRKTQVSANSFAIEAKPRLVVARRVPKAVAERAACDYDTLSADHDLDVEEAIAPPSIPSDARRQAHRKGPRS